MLSRFLCLSLIVLVAMTASAGGLLDYARPDSDALIYMDVAQAEKAMDKALWQKIEADKQAARNREREELAREEPDQDAPDAPDVFGAISDMNPELVANITLVSREPLRLMVEGAVRFQTGEDGRKLLEGLAGSFVGDESSVPMSLSIEETDDGICKFLLLYNLKKRVNLPPPAHSAARSNMFGRLISAKPSVCLLMNSIRWAPLLGGNEASADLQRLMIRADAVGIAVSVRARTIHVSAEAAFRREQDAADYARNAEAMSGDVGKLLSGPILRGVSASAHGLVVSISADIGIDEAWTSLGTLKEDEPPVK